MFPARQGRRRALLAALALLGGKASGAVDQRPAASSLAKQQHGHPGGPSGGQSHGARRASEKHLHPICASTAAPLGSHESGSGNGVLKGISVARMDHSGGVNGAMGMSTSTD